MIVDRRTTLAGLAGSAALAAWPAHAAIAGAARTVFIDSRLPAARAFAAQARGARVIDIAEANGGLWREVRDFTPSGERVIGLTRWSDWTVLRGALEEKRLRVRAEARVDPAMAGDAALFRWEMR